MAAPALAGGASTTPDAAFRGVATSVEQRAGAAPVWPRGAAEAAEVEARLRDLLAQPLDAERAARVALLASPALQAELEELGIAQADLAQATRVANPSLDLFARRPRTGGGATNLEAGASEDLLDLLVQPLRRRLGEAALEATKLAVGDRLLAAMAEAKAALYAAQASRELVSRLETIAAVDQAAWELAQRQRQAGNIAELDLLDQQAAREQSRIDLAAARARETLDREALGRALGLAGDPAELAIAAPPELPPTDPPEAGLETLAMEDRLDLAAGRRAVDLVGRALALKKGTRFFPAGIEVGVSRERDTDRTVVAGPTLRLALPIFDTGKASIARLEAQERQSRDQLEALGRAARSEVRSAHARLAAARERAEAYRQVMLPLRAEILDQTLLHYDMMLKGAYDVLLARQREAESEKAWVESWRDYWLARVELERAVGGRLPEGGPR